jgi:hypothetical protein
MRLVGFISNAIAPHTATSVVFEKNIPGKVLAITPNSRFATRNLCLHTKIY